MPAAKILVRDLSPTLLAGVLYLGSGFGLQAWRFLRRRRSSARVEARLTRNDIRLLVPIVILGGVLGPLLCMWGLAHTPASTAALLLNFEVVFTVLLAWFVFRENFDRRTAWGMAAIVAGGILLSWVGRPELSGGAVAGPLAVVGACLCWALDNNLTRKLSACDPVEIAAIKGLAAGATNTAIAFSLGAVSPGAVTLLLAGGLGLVSYG